MPDALTNEEDPLEEEEEANFFEDFLEEDDGDRA